MLDRSIIIAIIILISFILSIVIMIWTIILYNTLTASTVVFNNLIIKNQLTSNFQPTTLLRAVSGNSLFAQIAHGERLQTSNPSFGNLPTVKKFSYTTATAPNLNINKLSVNNTIVQIQTQIAQFVQQGTIPSLTCNSLTIKNGQAGVLTTQRFASTNALVGDLTGGQLISGKSVIGELISTVSTANSGTNTQLTSVQGIYSHNGNILSIGGLRVQNSQLTFNSGSTFTAPSQFTSTNNLNVNFTSMTIVGPNRININTNLILLNNTQNVDLTVAGEGIVDMGQIQGMTISALVVNTLTCDSLTVNVNSNIQNMTTTASFSTVSYTNGQTIIDTIKFQTQRLNLKDGTGNTVLTSNSIVSAQGFTIRSSLNLNIAGNMVCQAVSYSNLIFSTSINVAGDAQFTQSNGNFIISQTLNSLTSQITDTLNIAGTLTVDRVLQPGGQPLISPQNIIVSGTPIQGAGMTVGNVFSDTILFSKANLNNNLCRNTMQ
ncbi:hypothetical protein SS50377_23583 [Spironucleus salmonicida]|uniref:Uncharacterized protein n=1 Tax=Spironucleus salmonicida TaxID=348837 RepID=V6LXX5_9EUKA|nr:hypothetical protein SS50377_23583 [Spironucleus salmonicida]|eukprot:EST48566.1 Hypothetical protein SS50377_11177 [Spironucleus salmonicida]